MLFVSDLSENDKKMVLKSHTLILQDAGYSDKEIEHYKEMLLNEKFFNIEDAISKDLYEKLYHKYLSMRRL